MSIISTILMLLAFAAVIKEEIMRKVRQARFRKISEKEDLLNREEISGHDCRPVEAQTDLTRYGEIVPR